MGTSNIYRKRKDAQGVEYNFATGYKRTVDLWRTPEEADRVKDYECLWKLYVGDHYAGEGGIWPHPYGDKGKRECIPYQQINLLAKATRVFTDLVIGEGVVVTSEDEDIQALLETVDFRAMWEALIYASIYGMVGIEPEKQREDEGEKIGWHIVEPHYLYPEYHPTIPGKLIKIRKAIPFLQVPVAGGTMDILYEETHVKGAVEYRLYEISGENIVRELDLELYRTLIDKEADITPFWSTGLDDFFVTILYNEKIGDIAFSDYTPSAQKSQRALNSILTQIDRILKFHADPKLVVPEQTLTTDPESGRQIWAWEGSEVLTQPRDAISSYTYLTWNGELAAAVERRDNLVLSVHTEMDMAPQLTAFIHLTGGTTAETAAKLKKLLHATLKRAGKKREWARVAIEQLIENMLRLAGFEDPQFSVEFPEFIPQGRDEVLDEVMARKQMELITTKDALIKLDGASEGDAETKAAEIHAEKAGEVANPFRNDIGERFFPPVKVESEDEDDNAAV